MTLPEKPMEKRGVIAPGETPAEDREAVPVKTAGKPDLAKLADDAATRFSDLAEKTA